jgi:hypothetical protein
VDLHINTFKLLVGLPNVENRAQEEAQSHHLDHNLKQSKSLQEIFSSSGKMGSRIASLIGNNNPNVDQIIEDFKQKAKYCKTRWNDYRQQVSDQVIILQSVRVPATKSSVGTFSEK